jgi:large subunit ribosomal protein L28
MQEPLFAQNAPKWYNLQFALTGSRRRSMPRVCFFTGRKTKVGRKIRYRGKPKYQGGIGLKITANEKRRFKPNLHNVRAIVDGKPVRIKVSTKAIKQGLIVKPLKRKYGYTRQQKLLATG